MSFTPGAAPTPITPNNTPPGSSPTTASPMYLNINSNAPPPMKTLVYSPDIRVLIAHNNKQYDVSADVTAFSIRRCENSVSSFVFKCANKMDNGKLRYMQIFDAMDRVTIFLKRVEWIQVITGYLDSVPLVQLYNGTVNFRGSCTLKRLLHTYWDPGLPSAQEIFNQMGAANTLDEPQAGEQIMGDSGLGNLLRRALVKVGNWDPAQIHVQRFPMGYYLFMEQMLKSYAGADQAAEAFKRLLLGDDTTGGTGAAAGRELGTTRGAFVVTQPERMQEVIRAVDEMGMGPDNISTALGQGIQAAATQSADNKDKPAWQTSSEVGKNFSDAAMKNDAAVHCFMVIAVESHWTMYANASDPETLTFPHDAISPDHDSSGLYQQRMQGWGSAAQRMNPRESSMMFLKALSAQDWRNMDRGEACANVQRPRSDLRGKYKEQESAAIEQVRAIRQGTGSTPSGQQNPGLSTGVGATAITTTPPIPVTSGVPGLGAGAGNSLATPTTNGVPSVTAAAGTTPGTPQYNTAGALSCARAQMGKPYVWGATGPASFDCIAEGMFVTTERGEVPIEDVSTSDRVLTRKGWRRVMRAWKVRDDAELVEIVVNGRALRGTADHRVWTENRGWVALGEITRFDTLVSCLAQTELSSKASHIIATQTRHEPAIAPTFSDQGSLCTLLSGNTITVVKSQKDMRSITQTTTPSITPRRTSSVKNSPSTDERVKLIADCTTMSVRSVAQPSGPIVRHSAHSGSVVVSTSRSSTTTSIKLRRSVYDLSVEGEHEFFASGVLVHNCSGLMYYCYKSIGVNIGRDTPSERATLQKIPASALVPGDLIQPNDGHVVMWTGNGTIIEAPQQGDVVHEKPIYFNPATSTCLHVPGTQYGGTPFAPFDPAAIGPGAIPGTTAPGQFGGTAQVGSNEQIARNLFTYQFNPTTNFINYVSMLYGNPNNGSPPEAAFMNDEPLWHTIISFARAGLRSIASAPNGDILAYYPDYFGLDNKQAIFTLEDIEMKNVGIDKNDDALATHVYVAGSALPLGGSMGVIGWLGTKGIATVENTALFAMMQQVAPQVPGSAITSGAEMMKKFGVRPLQQEMPNIVNGPMELLMAIGIFMEKWAQQYATQVEICFMPELFPGMRLNLEGHHLQVYVAEVVHSGDFESGFTTTATIMAPSNPVIANLANEVLNSFGAQNRSLLDFLGNASTWLAG